MNKLYMTTKGVVITLGDGARWKGMLREVKVIAGPEKVRKSEKRTP